ncbi:hypothetical protein EDM56_16505 [Brevibacillus fluminis]|uniref:Uncharacterized protein n=1 Tax=Brevibacillus fluminis TaxID=511487 RepID=A0A3M8DGM7_9BACL|nr:hypothetical protein EDM56_16505 [Brevibacillus fluminis]
MTTIRIFPDICNKKPLNSSLFFFTLIGYFDKHRYRIHKNEQIRLFRFFVRKTFDRTHTKYNEQKYGLPKRKKTIALVRTIGLFTIR